MRRSNFQFAIRNPQFAIRNASYRLTRAVPPFMTRSTSASVAMLVSPGVVMASAPWAAPHSTAYCGPLAREKAVDQTRGEAIAAADAVVDLEVRPRRSLRRTRRRLGDGAPVVAAGGLGDAQRRGHDLEVAGTLGRPSPIIFRNDSPDQRGDVARRRPRPRSRERREKSSSLPNITSTRRASSRLTSARFLCAADAFPQRRAVVQVVGDDRAVPPCGLHRPRGPRRAWSRKARRRCRRCETSAPDCRRSASQSMSPGFSLRGGRVAAVGAAHRGATAESALGEVQAVAGAAADAVVRRPSCTQEMSHAALVDQVFQQPADRIVGEGGDDGGALAEAAPQAAGDVVLAAAFPDLERAAWWRCGRRPDRAAASLRRG